MNEKQLEDNKFDNKLWKALEITSRDSNIYLVSKILSTEKTHPTKMDMEMYLYSQLDFNKKTWLGDENESENESQDRKNERQRINKLKNKLINFEKNVFKSPLGNTSSQFDSFKNSQVFLNITDIEKAISKVIKQTFSFSLIHLDDPENIKIILSLYNFIIKAKILTMQQLTQLLFRIFKNSVAIVKPGQLFSNISWTLCQFFVGKKRKFLIKQKHIYSAMIAISIEEIFTENFEKNKKMSKDLYNFGWSTSSSPMHLFVHEFGHALIKFYSLTPKLRINNNINIFTSDESLKNISLQMEYHFLKKFKEKGLFIGTTKILDASIEFMLKKILPNERYIDDIAIYKFAFWTLVPGFYGRKFSTGKISSEEWFAEGFAYYFLTPSNERNIIWSWWHQLFTRELLKFNLPEE